MWRSRPWFDCCDLIIQEGRIWRIVQHPDAEGPAPGDRVVDASGWVLLPGFINLHAHTPMTVLRDVTEDKPLARWLREEVWPRELRMRSWELLEGSKAALDEMLRSGFTTVLDMYRSMDVVGRLAEGRGMRAYLACGLVGWWPLSELGLRGALRLRRKFEGSRRVQVALGPHSPRYCPPAYLRRVLNLAGRAGMIVHMHCGEDPQEAGLWRKRHGYTPAEFLCNQLRGRSAPRVILAHAVHLGDPEIGRLAELPVGVAHCPTANVRLLGRTAVVRRLLEAGVPVGLGTDGAPSVGRLDAFSTIRDCALLAASGGDDAQLSPMQVLWMATRGGALALGRKELGQLSPGSAADLVALDMELMGTRRPGIKAACRALVWSARPDQVRMVMVDGIAVWTGRTEGPS